MFLKLKQWLLLASMIKNEMYNYTRTNMLGYSIKDIDGVSRFYGLRETYNRVLDEALLNVSQGKETFDVSMSRIMKEIGGSGLKTLNYQSGRKIRLDSAVSMHLKDNLQALHNELKNVYGKEFGADGVEISFIVTQLQTMQKYKEEYLAMKNLKSYKMEKWQKIIKINIILDHDNKYGYRPISTMNCYHNTFPIILGINESSYSDEQLQKIIEDNNKGFEFEDKHYTNYQGTQLQRNLDRAIREQKDIQILGKASDNNELIQQSQAKITMLTNKYRKLSKVSGLPNKPNRLRVSEYRRKKVK